VYYKQLHNKIRSIPPKRVLTERIRIPNYQKMGLLASSFFRHSLRMF
jgi:phytoene synthase